VKAYKEKKGAALLQEGVHLVAESDTEPGSKDGLPTIATTEAAVFLKNQLLHQEVFGPYSLVIRCADIKEMMEVARQMEGQLTSTIIGSENDLINHMDLVELIKDKCGRVILNSVPTGVEVCLSMHHGGPFPATTDSRFTAVGADAIKRFARPLTFQNWSNALLPDELKNENPLQLMRRVNGQWTRTSQ
jgi:NADP-dependent aldehyde dehydrogenase